MVTTKFFGSMLVIEIVKRKVTWAFLKVTWYYLNKC